MRLMLQWALILILVSCAVSEASADVIISTVGDQDALGTATLPDGTLPIGPFDNRSAAELAATDGSENTDFAILQSGVNRDVVFTHTYMLGAGNVVTHAFLELGIGGMQSNDTDPNTSTLGEDALRINGVLVPGAFAGIDQGSRGYGIITIVLPEWILTGLTVAQALVSIDLNSNAGFGPASRSEPVFYDLSRLTITTSAVPEPSSVWLLVTGTALLHQANRQDANRTIKAYSAGRMDLQSHSDSSLDEYAPQTLRGLYEDKYFCQWQGATER